jgi:oxygen-independent coproporphyrinogen III oxidase
MEQSKAKSLYVHIPFCQHICAYCDFVRVGYHSDLAERFLERCKQDLSLRQGETFDTIYIGGGTPSALSPDQLKTLLSMVSPFCNPTCEFTLEANPENFSEDKIRLCVEYGVNRISLGVQSVQIKLLQLIGRKHSLEDAENVIENLRKHGINNISADGMYGLPTQTLTDFEETLTWMIHQKLPHVSLYALTIEPNSAFGRKHIKSVDNSLEGDFYQLAEDMLVKAGYQHYEISNFCMPDKESRHNLTYWHYEDFVAIGPGAAGKENHRRYTITKNIHRYLMEGIVYDEDIQLSVEDEMFEFVMMGLRLQSGIERKRFVERFNISMEDAFKFAVNKNIEKGWLNFSDTHIHPSNEGRLFLHDLLIDFMEVEPVNG